MFVACNLGMSEIAGLDIGLTWNAWPKDVAQQQTDEDGVTSHQRPSSFVVVAKQLTQ